MHTAVVATDLSVGPTETALFHVGTDVAGRVRTSTEHRERVLGESVFGELSRPRAGIPYSYMKYTIPVFAGRARETGEIREK